MGIGWRRRTRRGGNQAIGGRKGSAAIACAILAGTIGGIARGGKGALTFKYGTPMTAPHAPRQWQPPEQHPACPIGGIGASGTAHGCAAASWHCGDITPDMVMGALAPLAMVSVALSGPATAVTANAAHASSASISMLRKNRE